MQVTIKQLMQVSPLLVKETLNRINHYVAVKAGDGAFPLQPFEIYGIKCKLLFLKVPTGVKISLHIAEKFKVETEIASDSFASKVGIEFQNLDIILEDNYFDIVPEREKVIKVEGDYDIELLKREISITSVFDISH